MNTYLIKYISHGQLQESKEFQAMELSTALHQFLINYRPKEILSIEKLKV